MGFRPALALIAFPWGVAHGQAVAHGQDAARERLAGAFAEDVQLFLEDNCFECHDSFMKSGGLDLTRFATLDDVANSMKTWQLILRRLDAGEMPPDDASRHPTADYASRS